MSITIFASEIVDYGANIAGKSPKIAIPENLKNAFKNFKMPKLPTNWKIKPSILARKRNLLILAAVVVVVIGLLVVRNLRSSPKSLVQGAAQTDFSPQTQATVNRRFEIPIRSGNGKDTGNDLAVTLTTIDRSKRILIQGQPATARDTKMFLILNLEIENSTSDQLTVRPVDFVRLVDSQNHSFAPDIHNNDVSAEPISIKKTRVGFVVDDNQKNFKFLFGEINGDKQTVEISI